MLVNEMNLYFDTAVSEQYHSHTQIARVLTESWVASNMYCPRCGNLRLSRFPNNRPVADFFCPKCNSQYELKSKAGELGQKVNDGAYETMIRRITSNQNPDFFFMGYSRQHQNVDSLILIPKHFFVPSVIEKRAPLAEAARRAGWVGCNILISKIPQQGRIPVIEHGKVLNPSNVVEKVTKSLALQTESIDARGWLMDVLNCVNHIDSAAFTLTDMYAFEDFLSSRHPNNKHIRDKIRQQLQVLRDKGYIDFVSRGCYRKVE